MGCLTVRSSLSATAVLVDGLGVRNHPFASRVSGALRYRGQGLLESDDAGSHRRLGGWDRSRDLPVGFSTHLLDVCRAPITMPRGACCSSSGIVPVGRHGRVPRDASQCAARTQNGSAAGAAEPWDGTREGQVRRRATMPAAARSMRRVARLAGESAGTGSAAGARA